MATLPTYLDALLFGLRDIYVNGVQFTNRVGINFTGLVTAVDNVAANRIDLALGSPPVPTVITGNTTLAQSSSQLVGVNSHGGSFTIILPTMDIGDVITFEDWGIYIHTNIINLSSVYQWQDPHTFAMTGLDSYIWGTYEASGSTLTVRLVNDTTHGTYLKIL